MRNFHEIRQKIYVAFRGVLKWTKTRDNKPRKWKKIHAWNISLINTFQQGRHFENIETCVTQHICLT